MNTNFGSHYLVRTCSSFLQVPLNPPGARLRSRKASPPKFLHTQREYNLQYGPRTMFVLVTTQVSCVWIQLGIKSIIPAPFPPNHPSPGPREMETERQTSCGSPGRDGVCVFCVLVLCPSGTLRNNLESNLEWRWPHYKSFLAGAHRKQAPSLHLPVSGEQGQLLPLQSASFRDCWREQDPQL